MATYIRVNIGSGNGLVPHMISQRMFVDDNDLMLYL